MLNERTYLITVLILFAIIGFLVFKLYSKRREDIIKLVITKEELPPPAPNTTWMQNGVCFLEDKSVGRVNGKFCQQIKAV